MVGAVRAYGDAIENDQLTHDGNEAFIQHVANCRFIRRSENRIPDPPEQLILAKERPDSLNKIDLAVAAVLSWEARIDAQTEDATNAPTKTIRYTDLRSETGVEGVMVGGIWMSGADADRYVDAEDRVEPSRGRPRR